MGMHDIALLMSFVLTAQNEWFFSTWTHDHHVPIDNSDTPQPSALDTRVPRDDDGMQTL